MYVTRCVRVDFALGFGLGAVGGMASQAVASLALGRLGRLARLGQRREVRVTFGDHAALEGVEALQVDLVRGRDAVQVILSVFDADLLGRVPLSRIISELVEEVGFGGEPAWQLAC